MKKENRPRRMRKAAVALLVIAAMTAMAGLALFGCQPQVAPAVAESAASEPELAETGLANFLTNDSGVLADTHFNEVYVNEGNRGCNSCHPDLWSVIKDVSPMPHLMTAKPGYGQSTAIRDCIECHTSAVPLAGPKLGDLLHSAHYSNETFVNEQAGNCWSCHALDNDDNIVLWDDYKYTDQLGGYYNSAQPNVQKWLMGRQQPANSMVGVTSLADFDIDVTLSQPVSDEEDMFVANNYEVPDLSTDTWTLKVTGVVNEREFTMDELKALPVTERVVTQSCLAQGIDGVQIGNIPVKGVLVKDIVEACGGLKDDVVSLRPESADGWCSSPFGESTYADFVLEQNAMIAYEYWGHDLTADQGYPATYVLPGVGGGFWNKWVTELNFSSEVPAMFGRGMLMPAVQAQGKGVYSGWFTPNKDGLEYKVGEPIEMNGWAYVWKHEGHDIKQIAFSADYGVNWIYVDVPDDYDGDQWVYFDATWTPQEAGTYILHSKAIDEGGTEQPQNASVILTVTE
ncbi:molybdopterin-dependent oxidoreductase [Adlercreutzia sp. R25]|uniref:Molybdopterin-dependent oxidoreductase n=1 Tax=Adlercreutzia shanghongiae TaxID=3111773 RepID=A0ABU6IWK7_9ACTN|nr:MULTISPECIES: molybdopterin-dependent oxidoreductase [unclassified Adlercreutzia]MEC4272355.1 molybdopterin-dependent oxidoreductase [Adlercreutzia sp. R25]MEC4294221.1 molybdopterin-dependent oxidoreductase [Adlercreutzia sp. R22]